MKPFVIRRYCSRWSSLRRLTAGAYDGAVFSRKTTLLTGRSGLLPSPFRISSGPDTYQQDKTNDGGEDASVSTWALLWSESHGYSFAAAGDIICRSVEHADFSTIRAFCS